MRFSVGAGLENPDQRGSVRGTALKSVIFAIVSIIVTCVFYSCVSKKTDCIRPYTESELIFMDSIQQLGQKVKLIRFNYHSENDDDGARCIYDYTTTYGIYVSEVDSTTMSSEDSLRILAITILSKVYRDVIEDSILFLTDDFHVSFTRMQYQPIRKIIDAPTSCDYIYSVDCKKTDLENYLGLKVIRFNDTLVRRAGTKRSDTLAFHHEIFSKCE